LQRSTPDGFAARTNADGEFTLSLSPDLSADLKYDLQRMVATYRTRQKGADAAHKRFKGWKKRFPALSVRIIGGDGDERALFAWWEYHVDRLYLQAKEVRETRRRLAKQEAAKGRQLAPDVFPTPPFPGKR
jgi:hypothetical protein